MKKNISILFILIFMLQALPVMHWIYGPDDKNASIEMMDDKDDNGEKDSTQKELAKENKENIIPQKYLFDKQLTYLSMRLLLLTSENAIILHHPEISTPPPDINS